MRVAIITGSSGLVGGQCVEYFSEKFDQIIGIDNDMRSRFFGDQASTNWNQARLSAKIQNFIPYSLDIRDKTSVENLFNQYNSDVKLVIHCAAQPSHDWAAREPHTDFSVNATGTLVLLEATRMFTPAAVFIHLSTNKVYGDTPNKLPLVELETRWEIDKDHHYSNSGIDERMSIDACNHSLFGCSKLSADVLAQEYGSYFGLKTGIFRGGCLTGPTHSGTELHGFLSYLIRCCLTSTPYTIYGYKGKQVRDNIHSNDLARAFDTFFEDPGCGEVYNIGGSRYANCSILEAIAFVESYTNKQMISEYCETARKGDHIWYISSVNKFMQRYPNWTLTYDIERTIKEICDGMDERL